MGILKSSFQRIISSLFIGLLLYAGLNAQDIRVIYLGVAPNDSTLNWRSSGDSDGNDTLTWNDATVLRDYLNGNYTPNPEDKRFEKRIDINRNGVPDSGDLTMLEEHLKNNKFFMPQWYWNKLEIPEARDLYLEQAAAFDGTSEIPPTQVNEFPTRDCRFYSNQTMINMYGFSDPTDISNLNEVYPFSWKDNGLENIPLYDIKIREYSVTPSIGHEMNGTFTGNNALNWSNWNFFEPQYDQMNVQPEEAFLLGEDSRLFIQGIPTLGVWGWPENYEISLVSYIEYDIKNKIPSEGFIHDEVNQNNLQLILQRDTQNPSISTTLSNGASYEPGETKSVTISEDYLRDSWISWDRGETRSKLEKGVNNIAVPNELGEKKAYIYAGDEYWNEVLDSVNISIAEPQDTIPPAVNIISPQQNSIHEEGVLLNITASDANINPDSIYYTINNGPKTHFNGSLNEVINLDYDDYVLKAVAVDLSNNKTEEQVNFSRKDTTPPEIEWSSDVTGTHANNIAFNWNISDPNFGDAWISKNGEKQSISENGSIEFNDLSNGVYKFGIGAKDMFGNADSTFEERTVLGVGLENKVSETGFNIYPNPTINLLTIETDNTDLYNIEITSQNGQQILTGEMGGTSHQIDLSSFQKGIYFITIRSQDFVTTRKIVKL